MLVIPNQAFPWTPTIIRQALLTSVSAEARARDYVERRLREVRGSLPAGKPAIYLQAMPLIIPQVPWDVLSAPFEKVLRGDERRNRYRDYADLASNVAPRPTIDGLYSKDQNEDPTWETEIHRNGYVSVLYKDIQFEKIGETHGHVVHSGTCDLFKAFCHMLKELMAVSGTDVPYLVATTFLNAKGVRIWIESRWGKLSEPYDKQDIVWPEHLRATGQRSNPHSGQIVY